MHFEDEDAEETLDRHDSHISAVLSRIVVSDTSCVYNCGLISSSNPLVLGLHPFLFVPFESLSVEEQT